jgi:hypothetical protein
MIPRGVFESPRCATPDPTYHFLAILATVGITVVVYSAFLVVGAWLACVALAYARFRLAVSGRAPFALPPYLRFPPLPPRRRFAAAAAAHTPSRGV